MEAPELYLCRWRQSYRTNFWIPANHSQKKEGVACGVGSIYETHRKNKKGETFIPEFDAAPKEVSFAWNTGKYHNAMWKVQQIHGVDLMDKDNLERIIREKEMKARSYEPC